MPRIRIHFSKTGLACFISHIDLPMLFGRAARRAALVPEQTQGFSPHPKLALCPPLPVGVVGLCEPADFWFVEWGDDSFERWHDSMPRGVSILCAQEAGGVSLNKLCTSATYAIEPLNGVSAQSVADVLAPLLRDAGALHDVSVDGDAAMVSAESLERYGASYMVKSLIAAGLVDGWSDLSVARTVVGGWSEEQQRVIPLMEEIRR